VLVVLLIHWVLILNLVHSQQLLVAVMAQEITQHQTARTAVQAVVVEVRVFQRV
jgi:hypothetical protein